VYRAIDADSGDEVWDAPVRYATALRSIRASAQASEAVSVVMFTAVEPQNEAVGLSNETGEELWRHEGRVLHTTDAAVFLAVDETVVARDIESGDELWTAPVPVDEEGQSPAGRLGVVRGDVLVTVSGGEAVGLDVASGEEVWTDRVPLSADGAELGVAQAVAVTGGNVVVAAETGDVGIAPAEGELVWREVRDPLIVGGETNVWIGTADTLVSGQLGGTLRTIDAATGATGDQIAIPLDEGQAKASNPFAEGIVLITQAGVQAYGVESLGELWTSADFEGARGVTAVDGGVIVLSSGGIVWLRAPE
jgi:outer membrane protein assembly factor BamB